MKSGSLLNSALGGLIWITGSTLTNALLRMFFVGVLARILTPDEFGLMATGMLVVKFSELVAQMGVGPALVQQKDLETRHINIGFTLALIFGVALCGLFLIMNPFIARFFRMDGLRDILDILCFAIPIRMLSQVAYATLQREMAFKKLASIDVISYGLGYGLCGVLFALNGFGVYALVYAVVIQSVLNTMLLFYFSPHRVKLMLRKREAKDLLVFGFGFTLSTIFSFFARNGDTIVVSRYLGTELVGIYDKAYVLMNVANNIVGKAIGTVMFPAFSKLQGDKVKQNDMLSRSLSVCFGALIPFTSIVYVFAEEIVLVLLGDQWLQVVPAFQILCLFLVFRVSYKVCSSFMKGMGDIFANSLFQMIYMIMILVGCYLVYSQGIEAVAVVVGLSLMMNFILQFIYIDVKNRGVLKKSILGLIRSLPLAIAIFAGLYGYKSFLITYELPALVVLIGGGVVTVLVVLSLWFSIGPAFFNPQVIALYQKVNKAKRNAGK